MENYHLIKKKNRCCLYIIFLLMLLFLVYLIMVMSVRFGFNLPGEYRLHNNLYGVTIVSLTAVKDENGKLNIGPNIGGYRVYSNIITGQITKHSGRDKFLSEYSKILRESRLGYFIIDLHTKNVNGGLSKQEWIKTLKEYGINDEPNLYKPSFLDVLLGRNKP